MHQSQNEVRRAAAAAFTQSLYQLEQLEIEQLLMATAAELADEMGADEILTDETAAIDLPAPEEGAADVERFIQPKAQEL